MQTFKQLGMIVITASTTKGHVCIEILLNFFILLLEIDLVIMKSIFKVLINLVPEQMDLKHFFGERYIESMIWPADSLDLNPTEYF